MTPTFASITPNTGLTPGGGLATIEGTGFRAGAPLPPGEFAEPGSFTVWPKTVIVLFGAVQATEVRVYSDGILTCLVPPAAAADPSKPTAVAGPVDVTIVNVDDSGVPIPGESVVAPAAYAYALPLHTREYESDFARIVRTFIRRLKQQLLVEVNYAVQTDYDPTTGDELHVTKFATLPGLALVGPDVDENRFYSLNEQPTLDDGSVSPLDGVSPGGFVETRVPYTVDVRWQVIAASNNKVELLNLLANFIAFMHANKWLVVDRSGSDPTQGQVRFEMDFAPGGQPKSTTTPNTSNVVSWSANIVIRGIDIEAFSGIVDPALIGGVPSHAVVQHGQTADEIVLDPAVPTKEATIVAA